MEQINKKTDFSKYISYILNAALVTVCVLFALQNKELKRQLSTMNPVESIEPLKPGDTVESFIITTLDGAMREFAYADPAKRYLLFVLSTTCPHCETTLPVWKSIAKNNNGNCDVIGVSLHNLDQTSKYIGTKDVGFYLTSAANDTSFSRKYKIGGVPETILINGNGIVVKAWVGELTPEQADEIQHLMRPDQSGLSN